MTMGDRLHEVGIHRASEKTFAAAASMALCNDGLLHSSITLQHTRQLKIFFKNMQHRSLVGPLHYPDDPAGLAQSNPTLWDHLERHSPCVESKVPRNMASAIKAAQPCRVTRTGCSQDMSMAAMMLQSQQPQMLKTSSAGQHMLGEPPNKLPKNLHDFLGTVATPHHHQVHQQLDQNPTITFSNGQRIFLDGRIQTMHGHADDIQNGGPGRQPYMGDQRNAMPARAHAIPVGDPQFCGMLALALDDRQSGSLRRQNAFLGEGNLPAVESLPETQAETQTETQPGTQAEIQPDAQLARQIVQSGQIVPSAAPTTESTKQVFGFVSEFKAKMAELPPKLTKKQAKVAKAKATKMSAKQAGAFNKISWKPFFKYAELFLRI